LLFSAGLPARKGKEVNLHKLLAVDPTLGSTVTNAFDGVTDQMWVVIPVGLAIFAIIFGLTKVKKAGKAAAH
jgi:hypothetical protein